MPRFFRFEKDRNDRCFEETIGNAILDFMEQFFLSLVLPTTRRFCLPSSPEGYHLSMPAVPEGGTLREPGAARAAGQSKAIEHHPFQFVPTREGVLRGGTSSPKRGSRGQRPMVLFRLDFLQRKSRPPRQRPRRVVPSRRPPPPWGPGQPAAAPAIPTRSCSPWKDSWFPSKPNTSSWRPC